jgi:hypothetical protein
VVEKGGLAAVLAPAEGIGRHFSMVGGVPTLIASLIPITIMAAGAPRHRPHLNDAVKTLKGLELTEVGFLAITIVAVGLLLQPLQFAMTQLLEGYWGASELSLRAMERSARRHLERYLAHEVEAEGAQARAAEADRQLAELDGRRDELVRNDNYYEDDHEYLNEERRRVLHFALPDRLRTQEALRLLDRYPSAASELMPTRLGNVLRRYERLAGAGFGLDAVSVTGLLAQVGSETLRDYHDDARTDLDVATRMVLVWTFSTVITFVLLWRFDVWLMLPTVTSLLAYLSYRGTVASAEAYGEALIVVVALGRKPMYEALNIDFPESSDAERKQNELLLDLLSGEQVSMRYRPTQSGSPRLLIVDRQAPRHPRA